MNIPPLPVYWNIGGGSPRVPRKVNFDILSRGLPAFFAEDVKPLDDLGVEQIFHGPWGWEAGRQMSLFAPRECAAAEKDHPELATLRQWPEFWSRMKVTPCVYYGTRDSTRTRQLVRVDRMQTLAAKTAELRYLLTNRGDGVLQPALNLGLNIIFDAVSRTDDPTGRLAMELAMAARYKPRAPNEPMQRFGVEGSPLRGHQALTTLCDTYLTSQTFQLYRWVSQKPDAAALFERDGTLEWKRWVGPNVTGLCRRYVLFQAWDSEPGKGDDAVWGKPPFEWSRCVKAEGGGWLWDWALEVIREGFIPVLPAHEFSRLRLSTEDWARRSM